jgi:hypothetical protein
MWKLRNEEMWIGTRYWIIGCIGWRSDYWPHFILSRSLRKLRHGEIEKRGLEPLSCAGEHAGHDCKKFVCLGFDGIGAG